MIRLQTAAVWTMILLPSCKQAPSEANERVSTADASASAWPRGNGDGTGKGNGAHRSADEPPRELGQQLPSVSGPVPPVVWLQPGDLMTSTADTPIQVFLDNSGQPIEQKLLSELAATAELRTYPELKLISTTSVTYNPGAFVPAKNVLEKDGGGAPAEAARSERAYIELRPKSKLASAWHVLSLTRIPSGVRTVPWTASPPPVGAYAVRFHTGSQPTIKRVLFCTKSTSKIVFEFSENVSIAEGASIQSIFGIEQSSATTNVSCAHFGSGPDALVSTRWIHASCDGVSSSAPLTVRLSAGFASPSGVPLATISGRKFFQQTIDLATLQDSDSGDGCKAWQPE